MNNDPEKGIEYNFRCGYCKHKFKDIVKHKDSVKGKVHGWTSKVKCPRCSETLRTGHIFNKNKKR